MAKLSFTLNKKGSDPFSQQELEILFSYPNVPDSGNNLEETILHWFGQTLRRDGYNPDMLSVKWANDACILTLDGPSEAANKLYQERMQGLLRIGWAAHEQIENMVKPNGRWDPSGTGEWRFFLTLGVGIVNFKTLQMFHYPPARLLDPLRDSMHDPVTARCRDLLEANGIHHDPGDNQRDQTRMYETRINSTPIAAPDDQGTPQPPYLHGVKPDPISGSYIPIEYFTDFQRQMIQLYLTAHPTVEGYTIPMIVYGRTPRMQLAGEWMGPDCAAVLQMLPAASRSVVDLNTYLKTPVLGSNHPYLFYAIAQISKQRGWKVGSGKLVPENVDQCIKVMQDDLAVTYWQTKLAENPALDPWLTIRKGRKHWQEENQSLDVCALIWRQASLTYGANDPFGNHFTFRISTWQDAKQEIQNSGLSPIEFLKTMSLKQAES